MLQALRRRLRRRLPARLGRGPAQRSGRSTCRPIRGSASATGSRGRRRRRRLADRRLRRHPLLGHAADARRPATSRSSTASSRAGSWPWLADHRIGGASLMPAAALLEALARADGRLGGAGRSCPSVVIERPLVARRTTTRRSAVAARRGRRRPGSRARAARGGCRQRRRHGPGGGRTRGRSRRAGATAARGEPIDDRRPGRARPTPTRVYDAFAALGVEFGPAFRALERLARGDGERGGLGRAAGRLRRRRRAPRASRAARRRAAVALRGDGAADGVLPREPAAAARRRIALRAAAPCRRAVCARGATVREAGAGGRSLGVDLRCETPDGAPGRRARRRALRRADAVRGRRRRDDVAATRSPGSRRRRRRADDRRRRGGVWLRARRRQRQPRWRWRATQPRAALPWPLAGRPGRRGPGGDVDAAIAAAPAPALADALGTAAAARGVVHLSEPRLAPLDAPTDVRPTGRPPATRSALPISCRRWPRSDRAARSGS